MKPLKNRLAAIWLFTAALCWHHGFSQPAGKGKLAVSLSYVAVNDKLPYIVVRAKTKMNGRFRPVGGVTLRIYLTDDDPGHLIGEAITNDKGEASAPIPPDLKPEWGRSAKHTFLVKFPGDRNFGPADGDLTVARAKIRIDTLTGRKISALVLEQRDTGWVPVKGVDVVIAIRRLDSWLNVNQTATYSTDSTGFAQAEFKRDSIPGDQAGNIVLVAKVDDNDNYGSLIQEMTVPWGSKYKAQNDFAQRALYATRNKAPLWLLTTAYAIVICVWGVLAFLAINLVRIRNSAV